MEAKVSITVPTKTHPALVAELSNACTTCEALRINGELNLDGYFIVQSVAFTYDSLQAELTPIKGMFDGE